MGAGASAADGRLFCHGCGARTAIVDGLERPCCAACGATDGVEVTDARLPVTSPTSAMRALSRASLPTHRASSSSAGANPAATSMRVESVSVVALERPEDGGLLLRVLPNVVARPVESEPGSLSAPISLAEEQDQEWELPPEPACDAFVSRLQASTRVEALSGGHCVICAEDILEHGTPVVTLNCQHHFHEDCIRRWLTRRHTCPTCRMELEVDDVRYLRSIGLKEEAEALEKVKRERLALEQQQQAAERRRWVESMRRGEAVHFGLACGACAISPMVGECFRCKDCEDFMMCSECHKHREEWHAPSHQFTSFGVACEPPPGLLTVLVPPARETSGPQSPAAEVALAAIRSLALAPLAGRRAPAGPLPGRR